VSCKVVDDTFHIQIATYHTSIQDRNCTVGKCIKSANVITSPLCKCLFSRISWRWPISVWHFCIESYLSILIKSCIYGSANICTGGSCTPLRPIYIIHTAINIEDPWTNSFQMIFWDEKIIIVKILDNTWPKKCIILFVFGSYKINLTNLIMIDFIDGGGNCWFLLPKYYHLEVKQETVLR